MIFRHRRLACCLLLAGCSTQGAGIDLGLRPTIAQREPRDDTRFEIPALIATDLTTGGLLYWPTNEPQRRHRPIHFAKTLHTYSAAMAADGDLLVIPLSNQRPAEILTYNLKTKQIATLKDDYGSPYDVAIDKKSNLYALNGRSVTVYAAGTYAQKKLRCDYPQLLGATIGLDNEGDVFVNASLRASNIGVVEFPANARKCKILDLQEQGYPGGIGVDPKTDDLIVIDNPDKCAGSSSQYGEGRMRIYPRPYRPTEFTQVALHPSTCAGLFRLDKDSRHIYVADQSYEYASVIDVRAYPAGTGRGFFSRRQFGTKGTYPEIGGFATVPNALPN